MTLDEIANHIATVIRKTDTNSIATIKTMVRRRYRLIVDSQLWKDSLGYSSVQLRRLVEQQDFDDWDTPRTESSNDEYDYELTVPNPMGRVIAVRKADHWGVTPHGDPITSFLQDPDGFKNDGGPWSFYEVQSAGVPWQKSMDMCSRRYATDDYHDFDGVCAQLTSSSDNGTSITIQGLFRTYQGTGNTDYWDWEGSLDYTLSSTSAVALSWTLSGSQLTLPVFIRKVIKPATSGPVKIFTTGHWSYNWGFDTPSYSPRGDFHETHLPQLQMALAPDVTAGPSFSRIRWHNRPQMSESTTEEAPLVYVFGKRELKDLTDDNDAPEVRGIDDTLIAHGMADALEWQRQFAKANQKRIEANELLMVAKDLDNQQSATSRQLIPDFSTGTTRNLFNW